MGNQDVVQERQPVCPRCGAETQGEKFCPACGYNVMSANLTCPLCGEEAKGAKRCPKCGAKIF